MFGDLDLQMNDLKSQYSHEKSYYREYTGLSSKDSKELSVAIKYIVKEYAIDKNTDKKIDDLYSEYLSKGKTEIDLMEFQFIYYAFRGNLSAIFNKSKGLGESKINRLKLFFLNIIPDIGFPAIMSAIAELSKTGMLKVIKTEKPIMSKMMLDLYGKKGADLVYRRLSDIDNDLNRVIQERAYDVFWYDKKLNIHDKSLITLTSLILLKREEQTQIHMTGFLNSGGNKKELENLVDYLYKNYITLDKEKIYQMINNVEKNKKHLNNKSSLNTNLVDIVVSRILRFNEKKSTKEVDHHISVYAGYLYTLGG